MLLSFSELAGVLLYHVGLCWAALVVCEWFWLFVNAAVSSVLVVFVQGVVDVIKCKHTLVKRVVLSFFMNQLLYALEWRGRFKLAGNVQALLLYAFFVFLCVPMLHFFMLPFQFPVHHIALRSTWWDGAAPPQHSK